MDNQVDADSMTLSKLCDHIEATHHAYLRKELPRLDKMTEKVARVHGEKEPELRELRAVFLEFQAELMPHMMKEEQILFPAIAEMSAGRTEPMALDDPIASMLREHDEAGAALARLRELSHGFQPPSDACNTYRALFAGLRDLEEDLHRHIHLENAALFPWARGMAEGRA